MAGNDTPALPFPVFKLAHRYLLYDTNTVSYVRAHYNIGGVLIGGLPQAPQQNIFLGIPLELMPEEARLLVEKDAAYVVDDVKAHRQGFLASGLSPEERRAYQASLRKQGQAAAGQAGKRSLEKKKAALGRGWNDIPADMLKPVSRPSRSKEENSNDQYHIDMHGSHKHGEPNAQPDARNIPSEDAEEADDTLFASPMNSFPTKSKRPKTPAPTDLPSADCYAATPTTSYPPLQAPGSSSTESTELPKVPSSYPLFKHLHENDYFLAPGLRFGCQYMAYPGDPLRFHSHFLCNGMDWDQEFDLLDLVGGGRLGTGVKKGFLIGGEEAAGDVRAFCIEWGGM